MNQHVSLCNRHTHTHTQTHTCTHTYTHTHTHNTHNTHQTNQHVSSYNKPEIHTWVSSCPALSLQQECLSVQWSPSQSHASSNRKKIRPNILTYHNQQIQVHRLIFQSYTWSMRSSCTAEDVCASKADFTVRKSSHTTCWCLLVCFLAFSHLGNMQVWLTALLRNRSAQFTVCDAALRQNLRIK